MPTQTPPQRLGDFKIDRAIGRGGMGVVYEARQVSLNRKVALKVLSSGLGLTPNAVTRFHREAAAAARLHHTNIVPIYATGEQDGTHYYAMELINGASLDRVLGAFREAGFPPQRQELPDTPTRDPRDAPAGLAQTVDEEPAPAPTTSPAPAGSSSLRSGSGYFDTVARLLAEVADALDYAHKQGIIHRDVKPSNLMLSHDGRLSIMDFGLARVLDQPGVTTSGELVGSPLYMSPEQITAGRVPLDHRTDVYSLGATLYELLTLWLDLREDFPEIEPFPCTFETKQEESLNYYEARQTSGPVEGINHQARAIINRG